MYIIYISASLAVVLSFAFFAYKNAVAGWLAAIFWAVFAAGMYSESGVPGGGAFDVEYGSMWGGIAGLITCALYAFSIGRNEDKDDEDEVPDNTPYIDGSREETIKRIRQKRHNRNLEKRMNR